MSVDVIKLAEDAKKGYRFTNKLISPVFDAPKGQKRSTMANLFAGEWTKYLGDVGHDEAEIYFRGGRGYIKRDALGKDRVMEIFFIDVGQGDAILVQTADDRRVLIDGGEGNSTLSFLRWKYRLNKYYIVFDAVILSHGDSDHMDGLIRILNDPRIIVKAVYHNGIAKRKKGLGAVQGGFLTELYDDVNDLDPLYNDLTPLFQKWVDAVKKARRRARRRHVPFKCERVDNTTGVISIGDPKGLKLRFLGPINEGTAGSPKLKTYSTAGKTVNGNSVAVRLEYKKAKILLCGDLHDKAEEYLLGVVSKSKLKAQVFKANHHGSQFFTSGFLNAIDPWVSVVSSGDNNRYGHPRANLLGSLGRYAPRKIEKPVLFSTELAAAFKKISSKTIDKQIHHLYEKSIYGMIHVRTNGDWLAAGRTYGKTARKGAPGSKWKWEAYAFNLDDGSPLKYDL